MFERTSGRKDVYASLATGYRKTVIFYAAPIVADQVFERTRGSSKIVITSPLKTLMEDQVVYLKSLGLSAISLHDEQSVSHLTYMPVAKNR